MLLTDPKEIERVMVEEMSQMSPEVLQAYAEAYKTPVMSSVSSDKDGNDSSFGVNNDERKKANSI